MDKFQLLNASLKETTKTRSGLTSSYSKAKIAQKTKEISKYNKIFRTRMSLARFIRMIEKFNETHKQGILDMGFGGFLEL